MNTIELKKIYQIDKVAQKVRLSHYLVSEKASLLKEENRIYSILMSFCLVLLWLSFEFTYLYSIIVFMFSILCLFYYLFYQFNRKNLNLRLKNLKSILNKIQDYKDYVLVHDKKIDEAEFNNKLSSFYKESLLYLTFDNFFYSFHKNQTLSVSQNSTV